MTGILNVHAVTTVALAATFLVAPSAEARAPVPGPCASPTILGNSGGKLTVGTEQRDVIDARGGNDTVSAGDGNDVVCAGSGDDTVTAGDGGDTITGGGGNDRLAGQGGNDTLLGGDGNDRIDGGGGAAPGPPQPADSDVCIGGPGVDAFTNCEVVKQD